MLTKIFLVWTAVAVVATALVILPKITADVQLVSSSRKRTAFSPTYEHPIPNKNVDNTYTVQQMDQYLQGHIDAMAISLVVIEQAECDPERFERILREYFKPEDRRMVLGKCILRWW
jgi:hypothetical protein